MAVSAVPVIAGLPTLSSETSLLQRHRITQTTLASVAQTERRFWIEASFALATSVALSFRTLRSKRRPAQPFKKVFFAVSDPSSELKQTFCEDNLDRGDLTKLIPKTEDLEKWEDGEKWILVKMGKVERWMKEDDVARYRYSGRGYESKDSDGKWVSYAQMPQDVSHLTDAQRERLVQELKGQTKGSLSDGTFGEHSDTFMPLPQVPPLEKWPFYEVQITDDLKATEDHLEGYIQLDMSVDIGRAFFLASRWKYNNESRRHLGYNVNDLLEDIANMNGTVLAFRSMTEQLERLARYRKRKPDEKLPNDAQRLDLLRCDGVLGTEKGSAIALWLYNPAKKRACIDLCLGDDCMDRGPFSEEILLRLLASKAADLGAEKLWCRTRRTESGKVFVPKPLKNLGFTAVPIIEQDDEDWDTFGETDQKQEESERVPGLYLWMSTRGLNSYASLANSWCEEMGATDINEVADNKQELALFLREHGLTDEEKDRLLLF